MTRLWTLLVAEALWRLFGTALLLGRGCTWGLLMGAGSVGVCGNCRARFSNGALRTV